MKKFLALLCVLAIALSSVTGFDADARYRGSRKATRTSYVKKAKKKGKRGKRKRRRRSRRYSSGYYYRYWYDDNGNYYYRYWYY